MLQGGICSRVEDSTRGCGGYFLAAAEGLQAFNTDDMHTRSAAITNGDAIEDSRSPHPMHNWWPSEMCVPPGCVHGDGPRTSGLKATGPGLLRRSKPGNTEIHCVHEGDASP